MSGVRTPGPGPVIPPPKALCISADGDLASKLAQLSVEAECIKQKMSDGRLPSSSRSVGERSLRLESHNYNCRTNVFQKSSSMDSDPSKPSDAKKLVNRR